MGVTANDVPVVVETSEISEWIYNNITTDDARIWTHRAFPGLGLAYITTPTGYRAPRPVKIGRMVWPRGACRWAYFHCLIDADMLNKLAPDAFGQEGNEFNGLDLQFDSLPSDDPAYEKIYTEMYLLSPIALSSFFTSGPPAAPGSGLPAPGDPATNNMYLCTFVDERYFWQYIPFVPPDIDPLAGIAWSDLMTAVNSSLSAYGYSTITVQNTIPTEYLNASPNFTLPYEIVPPVIDAIAFNVGMRFYRNFDGECGLENFSTARSRIEEDFAANLKRGLLAGGDRFPKTDTYP